MRKLNISMHYSVPWRLLYQQHQWHLLSVSWLCIVRILSIVDSPLDIDHDVFVPRSLTVFAIIENVFGYVLLPSLSCCNVDLTLSLKLISSLHVVPINVKKFYMVYVIISRVSILAGMIIWRPLALFTND
jgi:hypothetical protein